MEIPWIIEPQTIIKHQLLEQYISPWMAILFSTQERFNNPETLLYFDVFCGPGIYYTDRTKTTTCNGSPLIVAAIADSGSNLPPIPEQSCH